MKARLTERWRHWPILKGVFGPPAIKGFVESVDYREIRGWAIHRGGAPIELVLLAAGKKQVLPTEWHRRADVAESLGAQYPAAGFVCRLDKTLRRSLAHSTRTGAEPVILANGTPLKLIGQLPPPAEELLFEALPEEFARADANGPEGEGTHPRLYGWGHFTLRGTGELASVPGKTPCLEVNGRPVEGASVFFSGDPASPAKTFQIDLPGYVWEAADADGLRIQVTRGGMPLLASPLVLDRTRAARWVNNIARVDDGPEQQYYALLALEHVRFGRLYALLDENARLFIDQFARRMGLDDFLALENEDRRIDPSAFSESPDTLKHWQALRELNNRLLENPGGKVFPQVQAIHDRLRETEAVRFAFIKSVIPVLCRFNELPELRNLIDFKLFAHLEQGDDRWTLSLAVPFLVVDRQAGRAVEVMWRLAAASHLGWLNTECLRFALVEVAAQWKRGEVEYFGAEKFRYAYIGVLDSFKGDWFSRLHDRELVTGMVTMLRDVELYSDYHRTDVVRAAIRHYGLCPEFWMQLVELPELPKGELLERARDNWLALRAVIEERGTFDGNAARKVREALAFFHRHGNPEALPCLREIVASRILANCVDDDSQALLDWMLAEDAMDGIRLAAFPVLQAEALCGRAGVTGPRLLDSLRQLALKDGKTISVTYHLQQKVSETLRMARRHHEAGDKVAIQGALEALIRLAHAFSNGSGHFLGCDLLASVYALSTETDHDAGPVLALWLESVRTAIAETDIDHYLPQPVLASVDRMARLAGNRNADTTVKKVWHSIAGKYGDRYASLFNEPTVADGNLEWIGWPRDTLVVVYSCQKYLDTRIPAIRNTWVRDLVERGIPYLILVGDGDDRVDGDVLALDVSDKYEDLPKKTLALFRWIVEHTDYQYALKIDDDCYLDVARYFDTLTYRKHAYYGRVIQRGVGSMDRAWHQAKSQTDHARKTLDKSPEPSVYADGGGGYTLSRLAMMKLIEAAESDAGQRLRACSLMEDKLVGDLLALSGIWPSNEDYASYQRRRTFGEALPVGMWENIFYPTGATPTVMTHLDTHLEMSAVHERKRTQDSLWPKRVWQSHQAVGVGQDKNQLELLGSIDRIDLARETALHVIAVVRNEMTMLPHFLGHYRRLGVKCFLMVDNVSDDGTREYLLGQPDVVLFSADTQYRRSHYGVAWQQALMSNLSLGKWVLLADADELLVYPECETRDLMSFIGQVEDEGADCVRTDMIDMYPAGDLREADFTRQSPFKAAPMFDTQPLRKWCLGSGWFSNSVNWSSSLRHRIDENAEPHAFVSQKYALLRYQPWIRFAEGLHYISGTAKIASKPIWFAHFKYHAGFQRKVETEIRRGQHFNNAKEYRRYAAMLAESRGCFKEEVLSSKYTDSQSFTGLNSLQLSESI